MDILERAKIVFDEVANSIVIGGKMYNMIGLVHKSLPPDGRVGMVLSRGDDNFVVLNEEPMVLRNLETKEDTVVG